MQGYRDRRFYLRAGAESRPMDEHEIERCYAERVAVDTRVGDFLSSVWARRPLLSWATEGGGFLWAANYALVPLVSVGDDPPEPPLGMTRTYRLEAPRWFPSPRGIETHFRWARASLEIEGTRVVCWPENGYAFYASGEGVLWEEALFTQERDPTPPRAFAGAYAGEAARLDHFLRVAAQPLESRGYGGPVRLTVRPSVVNDDSDLRGAKLVMVARQLVSSVWELRFPPSLFSASITATWET